MKTDTKKILIVDNEAQERQILDRCLKDESYQTQQAGNGETALELIRQENFIAIILEITMPGISGMEVLNRALEIDKDLAVIMITGVDERLTACRALEQGAYGYIIKPLDKNEVLVTVKNALLHRKENIQKKKYIWELEGLAEARTRKLGENNRLLHQKIKQKTGWDNPSPQDLTSEFHSKKFKKHKDDLEQAFQEVSELIINVTQKKDFSIRFSNPEIPPCYELMNCSQKGCPCYGKGSQRCWQIAGTHCEGEVQGAFAKKYASCSECDVYKISTNSFRRRIGEEFNNMMHILERKNQDLIKAYDDLKKTQK